MDISVVVPTYKRTHDLKRCLEGLLLQTRKPNEIIVVVRDTDTETFAVLESGYRSCSVVKPVTVTVPGQVAALNAGLAAASGEVIAITDDDTVPRRQWLKNIEKHFEADSRVGGVGGRDWVHQHGLIDNGSRSRVGKVQWFGRVIGNHHLGVGAPREVDLLKGANMSYRRSALGDTIRFQNVLKGSGAQVCNDMGFSMSVKRAGWKLIYDPEVAVDHYPAPRVEEDQRNSFNPDSLYNAVHNETYIMLENRGFFSRIVYLLWAFSLGSAPSPGLLQWLRLQAFRRPMATPRLKAAWKGRKDGLRSWRNTHTGQKLAEAR
jgi:cellulose synthase/poly-beta-1,6-N-acetylglucosamine synthase-like glycosyltransferase